MAISRFIPYQQPQQDMSSILNLVQMAKSMRGNSQGMPPGMPPGGAAPQGMRSSQGFPMQQGMSAMQGSPQSATQGSPQSSWWDRYMLKMKMLGGGI